MRQGFGEDVGGEFGARGIEGVLHLVGSRGTDADGHFMAGGGCDFGFRVGVPLLEARGLAEEDFGGADGRHSVDIAVFDDVLEFLDDASLAEVDGFIEAELELRVFVAEGAELVRVDLGHIASGSGVEAGGNEFEDGFAQFAGDGLPALTAGGGFFEGFEGSFAGEGIEFVRGYGDDFAHECRLHQAWSKSG